MYPTGSPQPIAIFSDPNDHSQIEVMPHGLPLLEELIILGVIFQSGHELEKKSWLDPKYVMFGAMGGLAGGAVAGS